MTPEEEVKAVVEQLSNFCLNVMAIGNVDVHEIVLDELMKRAKIKGESK